MKRRLFVSQLADAVSCTAKALPARTPVPVLLGMLLTTTDQGLRLAASGTEVYTSTTVDAEIADDGTALVSGLLLVDICSRLPKAAEMDLELVDDGASLVVGCGAARFTVFVLPVEEYPALPAMPDAVATVQADVLAEAVVQVAVAAATALPAMTGVKLRWDGELLVLDATDRYRMAHKELTVRPTGTLPAPAAKGGKAKKDGSDGGTSVLVPARSLAEAAKALEGEHALTMHWSDGLLGLSIPGGRTYMTRLLDGPRRSHP